MTKKKRSKSTAENTIRNVRRNSRRRSHQSCGHFDDIKAKWRYGFWGDTTLSNMKNMPQIDLILLDLMPPRQVSGYDVFDALRQLPEFQDVPVVAVTASDPDVEMNKARQKGLNGYISKPINRRLFPQQVKAVLDGEEVWGDDF